MSFDALQPYGQVVDTTVRVATWNTWARYGDWEQRQAGIENELARVQPDLVFLTEAWAVGDDTQAGRVADKLDLPHARHYGNVQEDDSSTGVGIVSRWPIADLVEQQLPGGTDGFPGTAVYAMIEGPRGPIQTFTVMLDYPLFASARRQAQVAELCALIDDTTQPQWPTIVAGDFNANPDSDEIRMLTGKAAVPVDRLVFYDSWEIAGDGSPGLTWVNNNDLAAISLYPERRFDYIFSAWPRAGGVGHPTHCEVLGIVAAGEPELSDHYGVLADLRY